MAFPAFPVVALPVTSLLLTAGALLALAERRFGAWRRAESPSWWLRAGFFNVLQVLVTTVGVASWDMWFAAQPALLPLAGWTGVLAGLALTSFVYYWWHRVRHHSAFFWRVLHRLHHSPSRVEVLTSFFRHPLELLLNGLLTSALLYFVLGLSPAASSLVLALLGLLDLLQHSNLRTPRWLGVIIQRPEMHRLHHARGLHHYNYSILPVWDQLFGTYRNPQEDIALCGFPVGRSVEEVKFTAPTAGS